MLDMEKISKSISLAGLQKRITGKTTWHGKLVIGSDKPGRDRDVRLTINSSLTGLGLDFPDPLNKPPESEEAFQLGLDFVNNDQIPISLKLGHRINAALLLQAPTEQPVRMVRGSIWFSDHAAELPENESACHSWQYPCIPCR